MKKAGAHEWVGEPRTLGTYNPCTLRTDGAMMAIHLELCRLNLAACGFQEVRFRDRGDRVYLD